MLVIEILFSLARIETCLMSKLASYYELLIFMVHSSNELEKSNTINSKLLW